MIVSPHSSNLQDSNSWEIKHVQALEAAWFFTGITHLARKKKLNLQNHIIPAVPEEPAIELLLCRSLVSWVGKVGESWPAAKPSLVTLENNFLSPTTGGLDDKAEFPRAKQKANSKIIHTTIDH